MELKKFLPSGEDFEVVMKMLSIALFIPAAVVILVLGLVFSWSVLTALLILAGFVGGVTLLLLVAGVIQGIGIESRRTK